MPRLMERRDWMQTVADVGTAESVWHENIAVEDGRLSLPMPESGMYHVIFVSLRREAPQAIRKRYDWLRQTVSCAPHHRRVDEGTSRG